MVGVKVPTVGLPPAFSRDYEEEKTLHGVAPPSFAPKDLRDSHEITTDTLLKEAADRAAKLRDAEAQLAAKEAELERLRAEAASAKPQERAAPPSVPPTRGDILKAGYKLVGALTLFLGVVSTYLGGRALTKESAVDNVAAANSAQKTATLTVEERVKALEKYAAALAKHENCVNAERDSAIERGTGHVVESDHANVEWTEQNSPTPKLRVLWKSPPWSIAKDEPCPSLPAPPPVPR